MPYRVGHVAGSLSTHSANRLPVHAPVRFAPVEPASTEIPIAGLLSGFRTALRGHPKKRPG
ncbi:hypothetical protein GCM10022222_52450 [Amycolatopsis ultiminotia]|uniref:Uncharacterized protein n=1 Tax=Amycolatopsis ultiminotia TaxID=543629 RepID=A0ABP6X6M0_9PSEU